MEERIINGFKVTDTYPDITEEENKDRLKEAIIRLHTIFLNQLTQK